MADWVSDLVSHSVYTPYAASVPAVFLNSAIQHSHKRKAPSKLINFNASKKPRLITDSSPIVTSSNMAKFRGRKRKFGRRRRIRFKKGSRKRFSRAVKRVIVRTAEPKQAYSVRGADVTVFEASAAGSRSLAIWRPLTSVDQGLEDDQYLGNKIWIKGFMMRGQMSLITATVPTAGCFVRLTCFKARTVAVIGNPDIFGPTTNDNTAPVQTGRFSNPRIFQASTIAGAQSAWVGNGFSIPFDNTNIKIIRSKTFFVTAGGTTAAAQNGIPVPFKFWVPIRKMHQFQDPTQATLAGTQVFGKFGDYYIIMQVIDTSVTASASPNVGVSMGYSLITYFRDI